jgi:integrase
VRTLKTTSKKVATKLKDEIDFTMVSGSFGLKKNISMKISQLLQEFYESVAKLKSDSWKTRMHQFNNAIIEFMGKDSLTSLTPKRINKYIQYRLELGRATKTVHDEVAHLKRVFDYGKNEGYISINPVKKETVVMPTKAPETPRDSISHSVMQSIFEKASELGFYDDVIYWKLLYYTGLRAGDGGMLTKEKIHNGGIKQAKTGFNVALFMHPEIEQYGDAIYNVAPEKKRRNQSRGRLQKVAKLVGYDEYVCLHSLRHSFTTRCQTELGMSVEDIKIFTGHSTSNMVVNYSHPKFDAIKDRLSQLA